jgi:DNA-binding transcriptional LysR family regulator
MDIPWDDLRLFLAVAETGSFSGAARRLRLGQPTLSRRMAELEELVDGPLFTRASDGVSLTTAGERLLPIAQRMAEWATEARAALERKQSGPSGKVKLAAPPGVAFDLLAPFAAWLRGKAPGIHLEIQALVEYVNLQRGEADLAVRLRPPRDNDLVCLKEMKVEVGVFAAESYARKLPAKYGMADLDWIAWAPPYTELAPNPQLAAAIEGFAPVFTSNDYLVQLAALEAGVGCMVFGRPLPKQARSRSLRQLDVSLGSHAHASFYLVGAKRLIEAPRIKKVAELLKSYLDLK